MKSLSKLPKIESEFYKAELHFNNGQIQASFYRLDNGMFTAPVICADRQRFLIVHRRRRSGPHLEGLDECWDHKYISANIPLK